VRHTGPHDQRIRPRQRAREFLLGRAIHATVAFCVDVFEGRVGVDGFFVRDKDSFVDGAEVEAGGGAEEAAELVGCAAGFAKDGVGGEGDYVEGVGGDGEGGEVHGERWDDGRESCLGDIYRRDGL
jgi:hypothetical protein